MVRRWFKLLAKFAAWIAVVVAIINFPQNLIAVYEFLEPLTSDPVRIVLGFAGVGALVLLYLPLMKREIRRVWGHADESTEAAKSVEASAPARPWLEIPANFKDWDRMPRYQVWQAACLWAGFEPNEPMAVTQGSPAYGHYQMLVDAVQSGEIKPSAPDPQLRYSWIDRSDLRDLAKNRKDSPPFLFPRRRGGIRPVVADINVVPAIRSHWRDAIEPAVLMAGAIVLVILSHWVPSPAAKDDSAILKNISVLGECRMVSLPISIPANGAIHIVALNKAKFTSPSSVPWGFYSMHNDLAEAKQWPSKQQLEEADEQNDWGAFGFRCDVSNHGKDNLTHVSMAFRFWFGPEGGEENAVKYTPVVSPLDVGNTFTFYVVNDCPIHVAGVMPERVKVRVSGDSNWREVPLNRPYRNVVEQVMPFFPTKVRWVGEYQCE